MNNLAGMHLRASLMRDSSLSNRKLNRATLARVLSYAAEMKRTIAVLLFVLIAGSLLVVAQPLLTKWVIDQGISESNLSVVMWGAVLLALTAVVEAGLGLWQRWLSSRIGESLIFDLRFRVFSHVLNQSIGFFTRTQTGSLVSRLNGDVIGAQRAFTSTLTGVLGNLIRVGIVVTTMATLSWQLTLAILALVPLFLLPARFIGRTLQALTAEQMGLNAELNSSMTERFSVSGAMLVKLFGSYEREKKEFSQRAGRVRDIGIKLAVNNTVLLIALTLIASLATALVLGIGGYLVVSQSLTIGTLLALVALLAQVYGPLTALSNVRVDVMTALVSFERVFEVMDLKPLVTEIEIPHLLPAGRLSIEIQNVCFAYPSASEVGVRSLELPLAMYADNEEALPVIDDVSITVPAGTMCAVVGPSGVGKSTLSSLLTRLYDPQSGQIRVGGIDVRELSLQSLSDNVGVVTQDSHMFHTTVRENMLYAKSDATDAEIVAALQQAKLGDLLAQLPQGLDTVVGDRGHRLSGGEKQRMAIARLLLRSPRIVVLDEATAHLDAENEAQIAAAFDTVLENRTSVVIAHRLSTVKHADMIVVMDKGRVVERGTHDELLQRKGLYSELYAIQFAD